MTISKSWSPQRSNKIVWCFVAYCLLLIVWKTALWLHLPLPTTDGVQSLSHTYSILRGDFLHSIFLHHWMEIYQLPYGFGLVTAPLMGLLPFGTLNNFYAASLIFALAAAALTYALLATAPARHSRAVAVLSALAFFVYPYLWVMRPEAINVLLLLSCVFLLRHYHQHPRPARLIASAFLVVSAGLMHPLGGLIGVLMITLIALENRWRWQHVLGFYALVALFLALLYLPVILINVDLWVKNFLGFFTQEEPRGVSTFANLRNSLPRFIGWGAPLLILYVSAMVRSRQPLRSYLLRDVLFAMLFVIPIILAGKGAYYTYLLVFMVWRLAVFPRTLSVSTSIVVVLLIIAPLWTHYFPTLQNLENPRYGDTVRAIMDRIDIYSNRAESNIIWVSTQLGMPIIDETYSRNLLNYYVVRRYPQPIAVNEGDEFLYLWTDQARIILENYAIAPEAMQTETLISPVPGLLTFESLLRERLPEIGLWRVIVEQPPNSNP